MEEMHRVLKPRGTLTSILIGQQAEFFNKAYLVAASVVPAFWGRQMDLSAPGILQETGFRVIKEHKVRQGFYPSRILTSVKD
jgi:ubiquinone/menaquinone biosynthesis C-methylase UbiE